MKTEILTVGDEILIGQIVDTNSSWIASRLIKESINVNRMISLGDNREEMLQIIGNAFDRSDLIIVTGGLGPTKDDITINKCSNIVKNIKSQYDIDINVIEIMMSEFDYSVVADGGEYLNALYNDCSVPILVDKKAYFWPKINRLQIWENGTPVYENDNGIICRDLDALADCLM